MVFFLEEESFCPEEHAIFRNYITQPFAQNEKYPFATKIVPLKIQKLVLEAIYLTLNCVEFW